MKRLLLLMFCLVMVACTSQAPQVSPAEAPVVVSSTPAPVETQAALQTKSLAVELPSTGLDGLCSSAGMDSLAPMALEINGQRGMQLALVDLVNGLPSCGFDPLPLERNSNLAVSQDGKRLAVITTNSDTFYGGKLLLVDFGAQKVYQTSVEVDGWVSGMVFNPDGSRLALAYPKKTAGVPIPGETPFTLLVTGFGEQGEVVETTLPFGVRLVRFTPDGSGLVVYGAPDSSPDGDYPTASAALLDVSDLGTIWEQGLRQVKQGAIPMEGTTGDQYLLQYLEPAVVYSPQENSLYAVHADQEALTRVDFSARQISTVEIRPRMSWMERILALFAEPAQAKAGSGTRKQAVLSPDGKKLYVVATHEELKIDDDGNILTGREPLGLQVLDPEKVEELDRFETTADEIRLSPDGVALFLITWGWGEVDGKAEVISTRDMSVQASFDDLTDQNFLITLSPAGKPHLLLVKYGPERTRLTLLDWDSLQPAGSWEVDQYPGLVWIP